MCEPGHHRAMLLGTGVDRRSRYRWMRSGTRSSTSRPPGSLRDLLGLGRDALDEVLAASFAGANAGAPPERLTGKTVCFTGTLIGHIGGRPITRDQAETLAEQAGLVVRERVTTDLDILVVADPYTRSRKAEAARRYGIRVVAEAAFWRAIGVQIE